MIPIIIINCFSLGWLAGRASTLTTRPTSGFCGDDDEREEKIRGDGQTCNDVSPLFYYAMSSSPWR